MENHKLLWNVKTVGNALDLSPWTVRRYITDGKIKCVRIGRRVLVEPAECQRVVEQGRQSTAK